MPRSSPTFVVWDDVLADVRSLAEAGRPVEALEHLVAVLRPTGTRNPVVRVTSLAVHLETERPEDGELLGGLVRTVLARSRSVHTLTEAGVPSGRSGFWSELTLRLGLRLLPEVQDPESLSAVLRRVFPRKDDHVWVRRVPLDRWRRLMDGMGLTAESVEGVHPELATAIRILAHHVASLGLHPEITERLPELEEPGSPFLALTGAVLRYIESHESGVDGDEAPLLDQALARLEECRGAVEALRRTVRDSGTSHSLTVLSYRLLIEIRRLDALLHLTEPVGRDFQGSSIRLFQELVRAENTRNQLLPYVRESLDLLAYEVLDFAARKGSKYIAWSPREYRKFFVASMGAGVLVAAFAFLKVLLDGLDVSLAAEALLFGVNYSICFVLIYLTGSILATKQPAMTANTLARALGSSRDPDIGRLKDLIVRVWRSQFISFVGNLAMAFPLGVLLARGYRTLTGAEPGYPGKATSLLSSLHPWESGALAYAAVAGLFLFLTGLVSGWVDNRNRHSGFSRRIEAHPGLRRLLGGRRTERLAAFTDRNLGILTGNVFFGFCLGSSGTVGEILGLPFDIRHIAFSAAHFGVAVEGLAWSIPPSLALEVGVGVLLIGLVNFVVSFGMSLAVAMESRGVTFEETGALAKGLLLHLVRRPQDFFVPPWGGGATAEEGEADDARVEPLPGRR